MQAAPVQYVEIIPGQRHFACSPLRATLDTKSCADRWRRTLQPDSEKFITCRHCPIGRRHHAEHNPDETAVPLQPVRASVCVRCGRPATRMIGGEICPSCSNRAAEAKRGYNARGNAPVGYIELRPRRVGIVDGKGAPSWRLFDGQHIAESMARATRAGLRLSDAQPGRSVWNAEANRFEYRDTQGCVLIEMEIDGHIEYVGVDQLHPGEVPAPVTMPTLMLQPEEAALWLEISDEGEALGVDWRQLEFGCGKCGQGMLHAYRALDGIHVRCSAGC